MIQYYHDRKWETVKTFDQDGDEFLSARISATGGKTVALEVFQPWLFDQLKVGDTFSKRIGQARCSDDDNYCKKTGRELALSRLKTRTLKVSAIYNDLICLTDEEQNIYSLRKSKSGKIFFVEYNDA